MKAAGYFFIIVILLFACNRKPKQAVTEKRPSIYFSGTIHVCDTCTTVILVHNEETTTSGDITVDSGTIYITRQILTKAQKLSVTTHDTTMVPCNMISLTQLYFEEHKGNFRKLWNDTVNYRDLYKPFRLRGKIVNVYRRILSNGVVESYPALFFRLDKVEPIDTTYLKKVRLKLYGSNN